MIRLGAPGFRIEMDVVEGPPPDPVDEYGVHLGCQARVYAAGLTGEFEVDIMGLELKKFHKQLTELVEESDPESPAELFFDGEINIQVRIAMEDDGERFHCEIELDSPARSHSEASILMTAEYEMYHYDLEKLANDMGYLVKKYGLDKLPAEDDEDWA